jgi:hypothetical protein
MTKSTVQTSLQAGSSPKKGEVGRPHALNGAGWNFNPDAGQAQKAVERFSYLGNVWGGDLLNKNSFYATGENYCLCC